MFAGRGHGDMLADRIMSRAKIGVFCGYDPRPWVMKDCAEGDIRIISEFVDVGMPRKMAKPYSSLVPTPNAPVRRLDATVSALAHAHVEG